MKFIKKVLSLFMVMTTLSASLFLFNQSFAQDTTRNPYATALGVTVSDTSLGGAITADTEDGRGSKLFNNQIIKLIPYIIDILIALGIAIAFVGGYKIMTSNEEKSSKEGITLVVYGIIGVMIMVSAKFIANALVGDDGVISGEFDSVGNSGPNGIDLVNNMYNTVLYPFIKLALYFVIGVLFFMMAAKVISFVTATDDAAKKKSLLIIIRSVVGILIVMGSKQLVEAIMGKQDAVLNNTATDITQMGNNVLEFGDILLISQIINRVMGLTMFIVLILIVIQGYRMFTKPDDPKNRERLKKTILYIIIGILVIGASYVISNVLVINRL